MAKFIPTKLIIIFLLVDLAITTSTPTQVFKTIEKPEGIIPQSQAQAPAKKHYPIYAIWFNNNMGNGEAIQVHPHSPEQDWGAHELPDNTSGYLETHIYPGFVVRSEFKGKDKETAGDVFVFERDFEKRCSEDFECNWNITTKGVLGVQDMAGEVEILFKWNATTI